MATAKKTGSLLIFEEDPELLKILGGSLALFGYRIFNSARLRDTLQKIDRQKFSGIVTSTNSSEDLDNILVSLNQKDSLNKKTPLIVLCGSFEMKMEASLAAPIKKIIPKPFDLKSVCSAVHSLV